jgi:hypothetical protein
VYACGNGVYSFINSKRERDHHVYVNTLKVINEDKTYIVQRKPITVRRAWFTVSAVINFCFLVSIQLLSFFLSGSINLDLWNNWWCLAGTGGMVPAYCHI